MMLSEPVIAGIRSQLDAVERMFLGELRSNLGCVNTLVRYVSRFRGKMLRPTLVLLSGQASGVLREAHIVLATVVEMVHVATLVHDDVLDDAELRRSGATISHLKGNEAAVLLGDYLISHSFHLCSSLDSQLASRLIGQATNEVCEGELLQVHNRGNYDLDESTYLEIIRRKTGRLCGTCCLLGAVFAGARKETARQLERYGLELGIAFQIQDDVLDLIGDVRDTGKTLGTDVEKGKLTLPVIHFLRHAPAEHRELMTWLLSSREADKVDKVRKLLVPSPSIEYAREQARRHIESAIGCLRDLPPSDARSHLEDLAGFVLARSG